MHYVIDGYNLLFQTAYLTPEKSLSEARNGLIYALDAFAELFRLHCTLVFDASFQSDPLSRGHYKNLELIYTSKGQTADDYIVEWVELQPDKKHITVITSDRRLQARLKKPKLQVEAVGVFLKRLRKKRVKKKPHKIEQVSKKESKTKEKKPFVFDPNNLPPLSDLDAWEQIFSRL